MCRDGQHTMSAFAYRANDLAMLVVSVITDASSMGVP